MRSILNGNDYYQRIPREEALCRQPANIPTILSVGAVKPRKGYHVSLDAFARLKQTLPSAQYKIVGACDDRKYTEKLKASITAQNLEGVHWLGKAPDNQLYACYREASLFLLAPQEVDQHFEGFGLVYLEAGAFGLPVVGVRSGGVPSAIRHGETGLVVEPDDIQGLADALHLLLTDPDMARRMGSANRLWAETLTWEKNASEHFGLYQEILSRSAKRN
jgi:glycosyltransferase involved in cell wall biosynthesis